MSKGNLLEILFIPLEEFRRIQEADIERFEKLGIISDMCRVNALSAVKKAGSGHLGSSFSSLDIVTFLYFEEMNIMQVGIDSPHRDIYFSSKGHDCPGLYSVLTVMGIIPFEKLLKLRRLGGLDGHPDVRIPGIEVNSGSLGMGISKAKGIALAKRMKKNKGRVFVMTGDGELQEGQIWEALQNVAHQKVNDIIVIVDYNKIQTDKPIKEIIGLGDLEKKFSVFGWCVERCNGHNFLELKEVFEKLRKIEDRPKILIADTIKGKGISFMEGPIALEEGEGLYRWHAGAPSDEDYEKGLKELVKKINDRLKRWKVEPISLKIVETREKNRVRLKDIAEKVVNAYSEALVELGEKREDIVVLDADLAADCGLRPFEEKFPERFIECGIAEQDMVSTAGGLALQGFLPIVNSFGVFLASRANEQIYTNACERTKIIYVCHYAGLIPAGPGKSHQSIRDISLFGTLPNCVIIEPCNGKETKLALEWCVNEAKENCMLRLIISPSPRSILLPQNYKFSFGKGVILKEGKDVVVFSYGPVILHEVLTAAEILDKKGISVKVVNMPWINRVNKEWVFEVIKEPKAIFVVDNHYIYGGMGDYLLNVFAENLCKTNKIFHKLGMSQFPECGRPQEVLKYHKLDGESLVLKIEEILEKI